MLVTAKAEGVLLWAIAQELQNASAKATAAIFIEAIPLSFLNVYQPYDARLRQVMGRALCIHASQFRLDTVTVSDRLSGFDTTLVLFPWP